MRDSQSWYSSSRLYSRRYGIDWNTEKKTAKWAMDMGFIPVKGQMYLQDLTSTHDEVFGTYKTLLDKYKPGGNRLKYVFAHTHMDENLLTKGDITTYLKLLKSPDYQYDMVPLSECLGTTPYANTIEPPKEETFGSGSLAQLSLWLLYLCFQ